jgi:hypothetical protein
VVRGANPRRRSRAGSRSLPDDEVVLAALGDAGDDEVADLADQVVEGDVGGLGLGGRLLDLGGQFLGAGEQRGLLLPGRLRDAGAERLLLRARRLGGRHQAAAALIGGDEVVHQVHGFAADGLATADGVGVGAQNLRVDHPSILSPPRSPPRTEAAPAED